MANNQQVPAAASQARKVVAAIAMIFGALTVFSGGNVLFGPDPAQVWAGNYVGFVVWFNFLAGGFYASAAIGLWLGKSWAKWLSALIAIATALVAIGFAIVVLRGTPFEIRTVGALALRFAFWTVAALVARRTMRQS